MNYYNEHDPKAAAWLRELIRSGEIPPGDVDERDIQNVKPTDLAGFVQCHFFAGIGGWSLALKLAGWPDTSPVWTGSCPCQPFSVSGKGLCESDERHLWPDFRNLIGECRPPIVFGEQVASKDGREWLAGVSANLEALAYRFGAADLCAAGVGAPHIRQRLYWLADSTSFHDYQFRQYEINGRQDETQQAGLGGISNRLADAAHADRRGGKCGAETGIGPDELGRRGFAGVGVDDRVVGVDHPDNTGSQRWSVRLVECSHQWPPGTPNLAVLCADGKARRFEPGAFPLADGIPNRVGLLRGYGNAIVPQAAQAFIQAYLDTQEN